jgi:hypothetical protein
MLKQSERSLVLEENVEINERIIITFIDMFSKEKIKRMQDEIEKIKTLIKERKNGDS